MLLLIVTVIATVASFSLCYRLIDPCECEVVTPRARLKQIACNASCIIGVLSALLLFFLIIGVCANWADAKFARVRHVNDREEIMTRIEYGYCGTDNCVTDAARHFNEGLEWHKKLNNSAWVSFLFFDEYKGCEPIDIALAENSAHNACPNRQE